MAALSRPCDCLVVADQLVTCSPGGRPRSGRTMTNVGLVEQGAVAILDGALADVGPAGKVMSAWRGPVLRASCVVPGLVDAHSHPLFAGSRVNEFAMRSRGATYQEIHDAGGGIYFTVRSTVAAGDAELRQSCRTRLLRMLRHGTTTTEAKSGYGLTTAQELRQLRLLDEAARDTPLDVVLTFMGAHAVPEQLKERSDAYLRILLEEMIPAVARQGLARFADVFCEKGAFTVEESKSILTACREAGFGLRIHAEEFSYLGGARMAAALGATTADHLQFLPEHDFSVLKDAGTIPVMTAGTSFFLGMETFAPARGLLDADLPVALGSDFNAGSNMSESMQMALSLAVLKLNMLPEEALLAATVNAAHSLAMGDRVGSLEVGKQADLLLLDVADYREWPYHVGVNMVRAVLKKGVMI